MDTITVKKRAKDAVCPDRMPSAALADSVTMMFKLIKAIDAPPEVSDLVKLRGRPSIGEVRAVLGLDGSSETAWRQGRSRALQYTQRLIEALNGEFWRMPKGAQPRAEKVWGAFKPPEGFLEGLSDLLQAHKAMLESRDKEDAEERAMQLIATARSAKRQARSPRTAKREAKGAAPVVVAVAPPPSSGPWLTRQVGGWADRLIAHDDRVIYVYGARRSGKSALIEALCSRLATEVPSPTILRLNIKKLLRTSANARDPSSVKQAVLNGLLHHLRPEAPALTLSADADFDDEMIRVLSQAPDRQIYLILFNSDIGLRQRGPTRRKAAVDATAPLFSFLRPVADENDDPVLSRVSVVLEGSRPLKDLCVTYPASPLNVATIYVLPRMKAGECAEQARLAGIEDHETLRVQTGGHRSLLWPILRAAGGGPAMPPAPSDLQGVKRVTDALLDELNLQPDLAAALAETRQGAEIELDHLTRLQHTMYLSLSNKPSIACPLLEAALDASATGSATS
jgi:hypothetical protein